jgi:hypothetical protein
VSRLAIPRTVGLPVVIGVALIAVSDALDLYDRIVDWGKFLHGAEGFIAAAVGGLLLLGYRDRERFGIHTHVLAFATICIGITFGAFWEFLEFLIDLTFNTDLQKSNTDTMTDLLWNDLAAVAATLLVFRAYRHFLSSEEQRELGEFAGNIFAPIGRLLDRHGKLLTALAALLIALYLAALWFTERPLPFVAPQ